MDFRPLKIPGAFLIRPPVFQDPRGIFVKTFHRDHFRGRGLNSRFVEEYYSISRRRVLRGLHFQKPPRAHVKLVYCLEGAVVDVFLDLRQGSPTFGRHQTLSLRGDEPLVLYLPPGLAHGFYVTSRRAVMVYKTTTVYSPAHDAGIHWASAGIRWPDRKPIVSDRDEGFSAWGKFQSPFSYPT